MSVLRWPAAKNLLLLLCLSVLLSACSRIDLAYRNLDWLLPWRLNSYLNLDSQQQAWLKPRLQAHLHWHCSRELPDYLAWLDNTQALLAEAQPDSALLYEQFGKFDGALKRINVEITPTAIELLRGLSDEQVEGLFATLDEDNLEDRQDFLAPPVAVQISERQTRMQERLRPWLGRLNEAQQQHLADWASGLGEQNRLWLENRELWQQALREALASRHTAGFAEQLTPLLQTRERFYSDAYRANYSRSRQAIATLFSQLLSSSDANQRERLNNRLRDIRQDFAGQSCSA
jgi:hypothetical protein